MSAAVALFMLGVEAVKQRAGKVAAEATTVTESLSVNWGDLPFFALIACAVWYAVVMTRRIFGKPKK